MDFNLDNLDKLKKQSGRAAFKPRLNFKPKPGGGVARGDGATEPTVPMQAAAQQQGPSQPSRTPDAVPASAGESNQTAGPVAVREGAQVGSQHAQQSAASAPGASANNLQQPAATQVQPPVSAATATAVGVSSSIAPASEAPSANAPDVALDGQAPVARGRRAVPHIRSKAARPVMQDAAQPAAVTTAHAAQVHRPAPFQAPASAEMGSKPAAIVASNNAIGAQAEGAVSALNQQAQGARAHAAGTQPASASAAAAAAAAVVAAAELADMLFGVEQTHPIQSAALAHQPAEASGSVPTHGTTRAIPCTTQAATDHSAAGVGTTEAVAAADALAAAAAVVSAAGLLTQTGNAPEHTAVPSTQEQLPCTQPMPSPMPLLPTQPLPSPVPLPATQQQPSPNPLPPTQPLHSPNPLPATQQVPSTPVTEAAGKQAQGLNAEAWASSNDQPARTAGKQAGTVRAQRADVDIDMMPSHDPTGSMLPTGGQEPIVLVPPQGPVGKLAGEAEGEGQGQAVGLQGEGVPAQPTRSSLRMQALRAHAAGAARQTTRSKVILLDEGGGGDGHGEDEHGGGRGQVGGGSGAGGQATARRTRGRPGDGHETADGGKSHSRGGRRRLKQVVIPSGSEHDEIGGGDGDGLQDGQLDADQQTGETSRKLVSSARKRLVVLDSEEEEQPAEQAPEQALQQALEQVPQQESQQEPQQAVEQAPVQQPRRRPARRITEPGPQQLALRQQQQPVAVIGAAAQGWGGLMGIAATSMAQQPLSMRVTRSSRRRKVKSPSPESEEAAESLASSASDSDFIDDSDSEAEEASSQRAGRLKGKRKAPSKAKASVRPKRARNAKSVTSQEESVQAVASKRARQTNDRLSGGGSGGDMSDGMGRESGHITARMGPRYKQRILQELASSEHALTLSSLPPELQDRAALLQAKGAALRAAIATFHQSAPGGSSQAGAGGSPSRASMGPSSSQGGASAGLQDSQLPHRTGTPQLPPSPLPPIPEVGEEKRAETVVNGVGGALGEDTNNLQLTVVPQPQVPALVPQQAVEKGAIMPVPEYMQQRIGQVLQSATQKELEMALRPKPQRLPVVPADAKIDTSTWSLRHIIARTQAWDRQQLAKERAAAEERKRLEADLAAARGPLARNEEDEFDPDADMNEDGGREGGRGTGQDMMEGGGEGAGMAGPRVLLGADGRLIIDNSSLQVVAQQPLQLSSYQRVEEGSRRMVNSATYMKKSSSERWSDDDTNLFYRALRAFGTDFTLIAQLFPSRDRRNVKNKFNREERDYPDEIREALHPRSVDSQDKAKLLATIKARLQAGKPSAPAALPAAATAPALPAPSMSQATNRSSGAKPASAGGDGNEEVQQGLSGRGGQNHAKRQKVTGVGAKTKAAGRGKVPEPAASSQQVSNVDEGGEGEGEEGEGQGEEQPYEYGGDGVDYQEEEVYDY